MDLCLLLVEVSSSHSDTSHSAQWLARRTDHYSTTHNNYRRQPSMLPAAVDARLRPRVHQDRHISMMRTIIYVKVVVNIIFSVNFNGKISRKLLDSWRWRRYGPSKPSKCREYRLQRRTLISQKIGILTHTNLRAPLLKSFMLLTGIWLQERI